MTHPSVLDEGEDAVRRARAAWFGAVAVAGTGFSIACLQLQSGARPVAAVSALLALVSVGVAAGIRWTRHWRGLSAVLCASIFAGTGFVVAASGGELVAASFYLGLVPLLGTLVLGSRFGVATALLGTAYLCGIEWLRRTGMEFPISVEPEFASRSAFRGAIIFEALLFVVAVAYDLLRRASLKQVADTDARYRALVEQSGDLVSEVDAAGTVIFASPNHEAVLGWPGHDLVGRPATTRVHPDDAAELVACLRDARRDGAGSAAPIRIRTRDGEWRWFEPSATAYQTGSERRVLVVDRDLTERLRLDAELRQSQKMDAIGQLAGGVAHDFNNQLMVISGYAEELRRDQPDSAAVQEILRAAEQGEALTRRLLAVSRPTLSRRRAVRIDEVVSDLARMLGALIGEDIVLDIDLAPDLPAVYADPGHLEQVLVNLAANARDAMPAGGRLRIRARATARGVQLETIDTGSGMDASVRERVFEAFFTTKDRASGTGLGLAVVYSLVRDMSGDIEVESEVGQGTCVRIELPALDGEPTPDRPVPVRAPLPLGGRETILLVEDRTTVRELIRKTLAEVGYQVLEARDGVEALELAWAHRGEIDLVLSDVVMPRMSGPELVATLRERKPGLRCLFMSGHPDRADGLSEELANVRLLHKPFSPSELCRQVRETLQG